MQATLLPLLLPQPPPPQCLYDQCHFPNPIALQLASPNFAAQTGGAKGVLAPTISMRPPFAHPPPLCRLSHLHGCPCCTPWFMHPAPPCSTCHPPLHARGHRRDSAPLVPSSWASCMQGEGEGPGGMCTRGRAAYQGRGGVCEQASKRGCTQIEGGAHCNATTGVIVRRAFGVLDLRRVKLYQGLSSVMHKYQVEPRSRLV